MTPATRRVLTASFAGSIVTGLTAGTSTAPLANLAYGLAVGVTAGLAAWGVLTAVAWVVRNG